MYSVSRKTTIERLLFDHRHGSLRGRSQAPSGARQPWQSSLAAKMEKPTVGAFENSKNSGISVTFFFGGGLEINDSWGKSFLQIPQTVGCLGLLRL